MEQKALVKEISKNEVTQKGWLIVLIYKYNGKFGAKVIDELKSAL